MAYDSDVKGVWQFNQSLEDEISDDDFVCAGLLPSTYQQFQRYNLLLDETQTKYGLELESNKVYSAGDISSFVSGTYKLGIGFWWNVASAIGMTRHSVTRNLTPQIAPIIAKADSTISGGFETTSNAEFIISEIGYSNEQNQIELAICIGGGMPTNVFRSEPYLPGLHHVFVNYYDIDASVGFARLDIDGKTGSLYSTVGGLSTQSGELRLNDISYGYTAHHTSHASGNFISDLIVKSSASATSDDSIRMFRYGWEHIARTDLIYNEFSFFGVSYQQPTTIDTNQIYVEGDNIFVVRSDGKIFKGFRSIWEREFNYPDENSLNSLKISKQDGTRKAEWTIDGLKLTGAVVTI